MNRNQMNENKIFNDTWIISRGRYTDRDVSQINGGGKTGPVIEYQISDLAKYLLNPQPIEVKKKLVGCELHYIESSSNGFKNKIKKLFRKQAQNNTQSETLIYDNKTKSIPLKDQDLVAHINKIYHLLKPYDAVYKKLMSIDRSILSDLVGICEDIDGNRTWLSLKGGINEKINYVCNFILEDVGVVLDKAFVSEGYFEMRGFDFKSYDSNRSHSLLKYHEDGIRRSCVLDENGNVEYWVDDKKLVHFMQLLEQSIQTNPKFCEPFRLCRDGEAKPLRLLFNRSIAIDYSKARLPEAYRDVFDTYNLGLPERNEIMNKLKSRQLGIMFQYIPKSNSGEEKLFT